MRGLHAVGMAWVTGAVRDHPNDGPERIASIRAAASFFIAGVRCVYRLAVSEI